MRHDSGEQQQENSDVSSYLLTGKYNSFENTFFYLEYLPTTSSQGGINSSTIRKDIKRTCIGRKLHRRDIKVRFVGQVK